ncbi:EFR1 family ferrodoxin [Crassaminicella profunda]|uniref:EFR1 family ferrodoxin n=1 Tax=Crassaminicella profunda TaxID=1286698 RepID=UPI001CA63674|nr:EFR1 family ferrodoxin [Crassaminicella profunda]QZY53972.1 EFR1 family ferrodoxin [Crassaminicella profunda]
MKNIEKIKMEDMKVMMVFFSATGNTQKIANVIQQKLHELNVSVSILDITSYLSRKEEISISQYDAVIFGFPIYSMRAPRVCREWLQKLDGEGKKCSVFFTFGGFGKDPAHYYIKELLEKQNFKLVSTGEFLGAHTFNRSGWQAAEGHPNQSDFNAAQEYTIRTIKRFTGEDLNEIREFKKPIFSSNQLDQAEKYRFHLITQLPTRSNNSCSMCGLCEKMCPTNAMNMIKGIADVNSCIACFRCIANCPDAVLHTNDLSNTWTKKLELHKTTKEEINNLKSKIYL